MRGSLIGRKESSLRQKKLLSPYYLRAIIQFWFAFSARAHCARFSFPFASVPSCFGEFHSGFWFHPRKISKNIREHGTHIYTNRTIHFKHIIFLELSWNGTTQGIYHVRCYHFPYLCHFLLSVCPPFPQI